MAKNTNTESSAKKHMDLGDHLEYIESLLGGGGGGGSNVNDVTVNGSSVVTDKVAAIELKTINNESITGTGNITIEGGSSAPVFDAEITESEESEKVDVSMSEEDKNDIYSHKYPVIGIHIIDEEKNDIILYFKIRIEATEANAVLYDNWDSGDGEISHIELTFMHDGDDIKIIFEAHDYSSSGTEVSGTNDGTNWTSIQIGNDAYAIPGASEYTVIDFNEDDQGDQAKLAEVYNVCPQLLRIHSNSEGLQMYRLEVDDRDLHNVIHYSCLIGGALIELTFTNNDGTYTLGVVTYGLTPINA